MSRHQQKSRTGSGVYTESVLGHISWGWDTNRRSIGYYRTTRRCENSSGGHLPELVAIPTPANSLNVPTAEADYMETTSTDRLGSPGKGLADAHSEACARIKVI
jgi:hypothetical protein